ncbi:hypothetical protein ACX1C1_09595 [Paenibacillus sp. strain BS8-2]
MEETVFALRLMMQLTIHQVNIILENVDKKEVDVYSIGGSQMDYRRASLIILFVGLVIWFASYIFSQNVFSGLMLIVGFSLFSIMPWFGLPLSIIMFFMTRKWLSIERLLSLLLLIPFLLTVAIPTVNQRIELYKEPTDSIIRSYYQTFELSQPKVLDLSNPFIEYTDHNKTMLLNIKLVPELVAKKMDIYLEGNADAPVDGYAKHFMNVLSLQFITRSKRINEINLRPNHLIVHGYWGTELLLVVHYKKVKNEYIITEPFPTLKLIEENTQGYLEYQSDGIVKKLKVYDREGEALPIELELSDY